MTRCKYPGCASYDLNEHPESRLCDKCWWRVRAEGMEGALKVLNTWAAFDSGAELTPNNVVKLCIKTLRSCPCGGGPA